MTEQESLEAAIHERVQLAPYDSGWPKIFDAERARLYSLLPGVFVAVEHFGSTAIPGMSAKPIIDILGGVESLVNADALASRLMESGYTTSSEFNSTLVDRIWFMRWADGRRAHHLHVVVCDGTVWREHLAFRDRMRSDLDAAARYLNLKTDLAAKHQDDREAYTAAKTAFVRSFLE